MIKNVRLYKYLMNFMIDAVILFIKDEFPYCSGDKYKRIRKRVERMYIKEASRAKVWEDISVKWLDILEILEVEKYCEENEIKNKDEECPFV